MEVTSSSPQRSPSRNSQLALGVILALLFGLLAFRGYGNSLGVRPTQSARVALTDVNRADRAELEQVPGIGPGLAKRIDDHRRAHGPFQSVEELRQVKGIGPATFEKLRAFVRVEPSSTPPPDPSLEPLVLERRPESSTKTGSSRSSTGKIQPGDSPINVNVAGVAELMRLPGVGPVMAQNIIKAREEKRFESVADLDRVKGIGPKTLDRLRPFVVVK